MIKPEAAPETIGPEKLAKRRALVILEVLAGFRSAPEASEELAVSQQTYYQLEERALKGLVSGCVPRPAGPQRNWERDALRLEKENSKLKAECARYQALLRTSQLSVGLDPDLKKSSGKKRRRPTVRAVRALSRLESTED